MPRFGKISGRVTRAGGGPLADLNVFVISGPSHPDISAVTAPDGTFALGALEPGRYVLSAGERVDVEVLPGKTAFVEVTLTAGAQDAGPESDRPGNVVEGRTPEEEDED